MQAVRKSFFKGDTFIQVRDASLGINTKFARTAPNADLRTSGNVGQPCKKGWPPPSWEEMRNQAREEKKAGKKRSRRFREWLAMRQRQEIKKAGLAGNFKSLCSCGQRPVPKYTRSKEGPSPTGAPGCVQLTYYENSQFSEDGGQLAFTWVRKCGSPMLCFMDAPKIRYKRSQEIQEICRVQIEKGRAAYFLTFTAPHDWTSDPKKQVDAFDEAKRIFKSAKSWDLGLSWGDFAQKYGYFSHFRCIELTDDSPLSRVKSGVHYHHHDLWFFDRELNENEVDEVENYLKLRWYHCLLEVGLCTEAKKEDVLKVGLRFEVPRKPKDKEATLEDIAAYIAKGASIEFTPGIFTKNGKIPNRISHWELMALALTRFPELIPRMLKIMQALKGEHWIQFDKKLLADCKVKVETEEEILKEEDGEPILDIDAKKWKQVDKYKSQGRVLDNIVAECADQGFDLETINSFDRLWEIAAFVIDCAAAGYDSRTGESLEELTRHPPDH